MESLGDWIAKLIDVLTGGSSRGDSTDTHGTEPDPSRYPGRGPR